MKTSKWLIPMVVSVGLAGCEASTVGVAPGEGEVMVELVGDGGAEASQGSGSATSTSGSSGFLEGDIEARVRVFLQGSGGEWIEVTRGSTRQVVDVSGRRGAQLIALTRIQANTYPRVRVEFERVETRLSGAIGVGGGLTGGTVRVDVGGDGRVVVEREIAVEARARSTTHLQIDLNASAWLGRAQGSANAVSEADFRSAVLVRTR